MIGTAITQPKDLTIPLLASTALVSATFTTFVVVSIFLAVILEVCGLTATGSLVSSLDILACDHSVEEILGSQTRFSSLAYPAL